MKQGQKDHHQHMPLVQQTGHVSMELHTYDSLAWLHS
jgi:hypothetical protein